MKIFLVEDDETIRAELSSLLEKYGYTCESTDDYHDVAGCILRANPQLVLLDVNLPYFDGYHVCRELRRHSDVPIIIVTSRDSEADELMSMSFGADDYVCKPYNTQILLARIAALLRRSGFSENTVVLQYHDVTLDMGRDTVSHAGQEAELTKNEGQILCLLMQSSGTIVPRETIMNALWQSDTFIDDNTLTVNINRLRKKLEGIGLSDFLITKRGRGYLV